MINASDDEIREFFDETIFEGVYSKEIRSNHPEYFKGHIHSIKINGRSNNVLGEYINVPISANDIPEGLCTFKCRVKEVVRKSPSQINFSLSPKTLRERKDIRGVIEEASTEETIRTTQKQTHIKFSDKEKRLAEDWQLGTTKRFIGQFEENINKTGYIISDIRRPDDFTKVDDKLTIEVDNRYVNIPKPNQYYSFEWVLLEYDPVCPKFGVRPKGCFQPITEKEVVQLLHNQIMAYPPGAAEKAVKTIDILRNQLTASGKEIFIYELLQNANDYPVIIDNEKQMVDVVFHITGEHLFFMHSGRPFNERNVAAICDFHDREKTANSEAIGYKGIGFKTVFAYNNYVYLQSGAYSFRFDWEANRNRKNTPWQILPIPTPWHDLASDIQQIFSKADSEFRVRFALRPIENDTLRNAESNYVDLFQDTFDSERVILFIPHINSVKIFFHDAEIEDICRTRSSETWCVSEDKKYVGDIPFEITEELNRRIDKQDGKIPEKYKDFKRTSIGFACKKNGRFLEPVEDSCLYCYLPAKKAQWGLGFLLNTDMIPVGSRENVEPKEEVNHVISKIAGQQFFHWIQDLMKSGEYDYDSILGLVPDFDDLIDNTYDKDVKRFLQEFKEGFEKELFGDDGEIIPVVDEDGELDFRKIVEVNYDTIGITCSNIISDKDLLRITDFGGDFVHPDFRDTEEQALKPNISRLLDIYAEYIWCLTNQQFLDTCEKEEFQSWLKEGSNCNNFLEFFLAKDLLKEYKSKSVFLGDDDELYPGKDIYEDIDEYLPYLMAFDEFLARLSPSTRAILSRHDQWDDVKEAIFHEFDADNFVDDTLLNDGNIERTKEILNDEGASILFYDFLAKYVGFAAAYKNLPFVSHTNEIVPDFNGTVYLPNKEAEELYAEEWTDSDWFSIISNRYTQDTQKYFRENFDVNDFSIKDFVKDILDTETAREYLEENPESHPAFVYYCFQHQNIFGKGSLKKFALLANDKEGDEDFILTEDTIYFDEEGVSEAQAHEWIESGWFYSLSQDYFNYDGLEEKSFKEFLSSVFSVKQFSIDAFISDIVIPKAKDICNNIGGSCSDADIDESIAVLQFLGEHSKKIAEKDGFAKFKGVHLYRYDVWDVVKDREVPVFLFDKDLNTLLEEDWTPNEFAYMLDKRYSEVFNKYPSLKKHLSISSYSFDEAKKALLQQIENLADNATEKEKNLSMHRYFCNNQGELSTSDHTKLKRIALLIKSQDETKIATTSDIIYMPDSYMPAGKGIEETVLKYGGGNFVSEDYIQGSDIEDKDLPRAIEQWRAYLSSLGVLTKNRDLVINSVLPKLGETNDEGILSLLGDYYDDIHEDGEWDKHLQELKMLKVRTGERFIPISQAVFVDCTTPEPFPAIHIPNQMAPSYAQLKGNSAKLLHEIIGATQCECIEDSDSWRKAKLDIYIQLQKTDPNKAVEVNIPLVLEIVCTYADKTDFYKPYLKELKLLNTSNQLCNPSDLTEGSAYSPVCDFQHYGFQLNYISDNYITSEISLQALKNFLRDIKVVYSFRNFHLPRLAENYEFAVYFWAEYVTKVANFEHVKTFIDELNKYAIIPSNRSGLMKKASELYVWYIIDTYVKGKINNSDAYTPLEAIFNNGKVKDEILAKLSFATSLNADHCLEALYTCTNKEDRKEIIRWLTAKKSSVDKSKAAELYADENFKWQTGKGDRNRRALKDLLVLDFDDKPTLQLFGKSDYVLARSHFSDSETFEDFCEIFGISPISISADFEQCYTPDPKSYDYKSKSDDIKKDIKLSLLIIVASTYPENWYEKYQEFCEKLDTFDFIKCDSIAIEYNAILSNTNIHYHRDPNSKRIYFVDDLKSRRVFQKFVEDMQEIFGLDGDTNQTEEIFDTSDYARLVDELVDEEIKRRKEFREACKDLFLMVAYVEPPVENSPEVIAPPPFGQPRTNILNGDVDNPDNSGRDRPQGPLKSGNEGPSNTGMEPKTTIENPDPGENVGGVKTAGTNPQAPGKQPDSVGEDHIQQDFDKSKEPRRRHPKDYDDWRPIQHHVDIEKYNPSNHTTRGVVEWKKNTPQAELGVADVTEVEAEAIANLIRESKTLDEIIDEHLVARYRMYHALKENGFTPTEELSQFIQDKRHDNYGVQTNHGFIHTRSAKGGILFVSGMLWNSLVNKEGCICMYYGNKAYDFEIIDSVEKLIKFVGSDNIIIQVSGEDKKEIINSIFSGQVETTKAHILIRIKSNSRYNSLFETTYNANEDNDVSIN